MARTSIRKSWRSARPGSTITTTTAPRDAQEQGFRAHIAAARETGLPLVIHAREADADMARDPGGGNGEGRLPGRAALLHRRPRPRPPAIELGLLYLLHRHPDLQEFRGRCATSPRICRPTASWSKPTRRISRPANIAANATSRLMWPRPPGCWPRSAASRSTRSRGRPPRISSGCSPRCRAPAAVGRHDA